jgi:hypothetical protein
MSPSTIFIVNTYNTLSVVNHNEIITYKKACRTQKI